MKKAILMLLLLVAIQVITANVFTVLEMDGMVAGGYQTFLEREIEQAEQNNNSALIILLNTPGGLVNTTMKMNELILNANLPVIVFVYPSGGIAASAGAFIVLASDIAVMAPVTTIGSAQPISITPEGAQDAGDKTRKFLARQARSLAEEKNRPVDVAADFVENNLALTSQEALEQGVIDYIATDIDNLLQQLDGVSYEKKGVEYTFSAEGYVLDYRELKQQELFQQWLSNPQIAMLLLMLGLMGLYVGFSSPGTFVPEVLGGISLILGIYGLGLFETNIVGVLLLVLGVGLIIAEIFTSGFGILGIGGLISMIIGSLLIPVEPLMGVDWYGAFIRTAIGLGLGVGIILLVVVQRVIHSLRNPQTKQVNLRYPEKGIVVERLEPIGMIKAKGELWTAKSIDDVQIEVQTEVFVIGKESSYLLVSKENKASSLNNKNQKE